VSLDEQVLRRTNAQGVTRNRHAPQPVALNADDYIVDAAPADESVQADDGENTLPRARTRLAQISVADQVRYIA